MTTTFGYDALGRRTRVTDPRTGTAVTHYDALGQVDWIEDAAGHRTGFAYDPDSGRKLSQTNDLDKTTYFVYNHRGQVTRTWGDVPYPVSYTYDDYGRMRTMTTYRSDQGFTAASFPAAAIGDTTTWHYDEATGQLTEKEYADGSHVDYTYTTAGQLRTRTWARMDSGQPLTTTYAYDPATGELTTIDYSDATPDIAFTYDRLGRQSQITDAVGTRTFAGVDAVIDKDLASAKLAQEVGADIFIIATDVPGAALNYGTDQERILNRLSLTDARGYLDKGHFAEGTMKPKIQACMRMIEHGVRRAAIAHHSEIEAAVAGRAGTQLY